MHNLKRNIPALLLCFLLIFSKSIGHAQQPAFQIIKGLPTNEVYDLMIDSKGLLWIAHDQGLSRYDGKTFKHFNNPQQSSRAVTGLIEDKYGRVWCYNFNAQIFWVKNDVMHLLTEYDASKEVHYPRITICQNELVATSLDGLFIYDLDSNKSRRIPLSNQVQSVSAVKEQVVVFEKDACYIYSKTHPLVKKLWKDFAPELVGAALVLENKAKNDTIFGIKGPTNSYYRFLVSKGDIRLIGGTKTNSYINTINSNDNERWVHAKTKSYNLTTGQQINGCNITDIVTDKEGNKWFSSLKYGLMMLPRYPIETSKLDLPLRKGDYIRNTAFLGSSVLYGTQGGDVLAHDTATGKNKVLFSEKGAGAIEHLYVYDSNQVIVSPSVGLYLLNIKTGKVRQFLSEMPVKDVSFTQEYTAISSNRGLLIMSSLNLNTADTLWMKKARADYKGLVPYTPDIPALFWLEERCRAAVFSPFNKSIFASYRSGLYQLGLSGAPKRVIYKGEIVKATTLVATKDKIFIGTATDDLLVYDKDGLHMLSQNNLKSVSNILQLTVVGNQLWIITTYGIRTIDIATEQITGYYELPGINPASIMDVENIGRSVLVTLPDAVCKMAVNSHDRLPHPILNLAYVTVNGKDTLNELRNALRHEESDLRFYLSAPWYSNSDAIQIAYRLVGNGDTSWQYIPRSDDPVFYASLPPGEYRFEARAFHLLSNYSSDLVSFSFSIRKPWWESAVFITLIVLAIAALVAYAIRRYYRQRLKHQQRYYEKELAIEKERQRISADIHDELGGTLSGIRLMTEITEKKYDGNSLIQTELHDIHSSVSSLTQKLREVIWSLSNENNSLESLLDYLLRRGRELFVNSAIAFNGQLPEYIPVVQINGEKRRHIYLAVKEALHNVLKHSNATEVVLRFIINDDWVRVIISDNGRGFSREMIKSGQGLRNMDARMQEINGRMELISEEGVMISLVIPLK